MTAMQLASVVTLKPQGASGAGDVDKVLRALRRYLGMDVAFVSQFRQTDRVLLHVVAEPGSPVRQGDVMSPNTGYCQKVVDGLLPQLIADTALVPLAMSIPETSTLPIGAHMSVPITLSDGRLYGTLCCFGHLADPSLSPRDLLLVKVFAELIADHLEIDIKLARERYKKHQNICEVLAGTQPSIVYQPIFDCHTQRVSGWEALSRFTLEPLRSPDKWFKEADEAGLGVALECHAIEVALPGLVSLSEDSYLSINCSPELLLSGRLNLLLAPYPAHRLVLEITEHAEVDDYAELLEAIAPLRERGVRIAIDDAGAGYASMRHILQLSPDMIKLDVSLTRGINTDSQRRAMASALVAFARETGSSIVAEGVETAEEFLVLRQLGADKAQGYLMGRPMPLAEALALSERRA